METTELLLDKNYEFDIQVSFTPDVYHLGVLKLSPDGITFQVVCEYSDTDTSEQFEYKYDAITCHKVLQDYYMLFGLTMLTSIIKPFLPEDVCDQERIKKMKKLRDDITHANEYELSESDLIFYINLLDVMATYLFLTKHLEISSDILSLIMPRHAQIQWMVIPKIYYVNPQTDTEPKDDHKEVE
jgi:hypothetical protein